MADSGLAADCGAAGGERFIGGEGTAEASAELAVGGNWPGGIASGNPADPPNMLASIPGGGARGPAGDGAPEASMNGKGVPPPGIAGTDGAAGATAGAGVP